MSSRMDHRNSRSIRIASLPLLYHCFTAQPQLLSFPFHDKCFFHYATGRETILDMRPENRRVEKWVNTNWRDVFVAVFHLKKGSLKVACFRVCFFSCKCALFVLFIVTSTRIFTKVWIVWKANGKTIWEFVLPCVSSILLFVDV